MALLIKNKVLFKGDARQGRGGDNKGSFELVEKLPGRPGVVVAGEVLR